MGKTTIDDLAPNTVSGTELSEPFVSAENLCAKVNALEDADASMLDKISDVAADVATNTKSIESNEKLIAVVESDLAAEVKRTAETFEAVNESIEDLSEDLDALEEEVASIPRITVDKKLDFTKTSTNPVENKEIASEFSNKQDIVIDVFNGIGEMWSATIDKKDGVAAVCSESGTYVGAFDIPSQTFLKSYLPPVSNGWAMGSRDLAICYSKAASKYVMFKNGATNKYDVVIYTSADAKQWRNTFNWTTGMYTGDPAGIYMNTYTTKCIYDSDTKLTLAQKGSALIYSEDCIDWKVFNINPNCTEETHTPCTGICSLGGGKFVVWPENNEASLNWKGTYTIVVLTYENGTFTTEMFALDADLNAAFKAAGVMHPYGAEVLAGVAYAGYDSQGTNNVIFKFDPAAKKVTLLQNKNRVRCSCKTDDAVYMGAKGKVLYKIAAGSDEVQELASSATGVDAVIQGMVHNPGTNDLYLFDDEGFVWKYDVATDTGTKLNNQYIEVRSPISRSQMNAISTLGASADLAAVINTINDMLTVLKS